MNKQKVFNAVMVIVEQNESKNKFRKQKLKTEKLII